jgi:replication-associated recombination protein RarA
MQEKNYYHPVPRGLEIKIAEKLNDLRTRNQAARKTKKTDK